jgi:hypothetical protein
MVIISSLSSFRELFRCVSPSVGSGGNEVTPDIVMVVNQDLRLRRRAVCGGMGIFRDGNVIAPADAVFDGGIDTVIGGAAADDKCIILLAQQRCQPGVIE